ncbi:MAG: hypothetical protein PWR09_205 [Archaeoglobi archaeon]|nr:hypothetical protein [Archaeoglobi archaeon]
MLDPLWASVIVTAFLAGVTGYYAWLMRQARFDDVRPILEARIDVFEEVGPVLCVRNVGAVAEDVEIRFRFDNSPRGEEFLMYAPYIRRDEFKRFMLGYSTLKELSENHDFLYVHIIAKDIYGRKHEFYHDIDLKKLYHSRLQSVIYQGRTVEEALHEIHEELREMRKTLEKIVERMS